MSAATTAATTTTETTADPPISNRLVRLVSKQGDAFEVELNVIAISKLVMTMAASGLDEEGSDNQDILLPGVTTSALARIIEFARHYHTDPMTEIEKPLKSAVLSEIVQQWYADFINVDNNILVDITVAVHYMDVTPLATLCNAAIAAKIKDKSPEEVRANLAMPVATTTTADATQETTAEAEMVMKVPSLD